MVAMATNNMNELARRAFDSMLVSPLKTALNSCRYQASPRGLLPGAPYGRRV